MPSLAALASQRRLRALIAGYPGAGKTGALACLANAGYKLRILDFDHNLDPLLAYIKPENYGNVDVVTLEDRMRDGPNGPEPMGKPESFQKALRLLDNWKYTASDGSEVNYGPLNTWEPNTFLVIDSLSGIGRAAWRRVLNMNNRNPHNMRKQDWGSAVAEVSAMLEKATSPLINANVVVTAHLTVITAEGDEKDDSELVKTIKEQAAELIPARLFPAAVTKAQSRSVAEHFPTLLLVETVFIAGQPKRVIRTVPRPDLDVKLPVAGVAAQLPQETGLLTIMNELLKPGAAGVKEAA